jgi:Tfp pilus assembly protein PilF
MRGRPASSHDSGWPQFTSGATRARASPRHTRRTWPGCAGDGPRSPDTRREGRQCFDERRNDIFSVEDSISTRLAAALVASLTVEEKQRLWKRYTDDQEAYDAYLRGRHHWNARTDDGLRKALQEFERAIARDPEYALAHAGLADCYTLLGSAGYSLLPPREALAIELNPGYASAHHYYGLFLSAMGRADEAIERLELAQQLDPLSLIISTALGRAFHFARRYERALEQHLKTLELERDFPEARLNLALIYIQQSMLSEALAEVQRANGPGRAPANHAGVSRPHPRAGR